MIYVIVDNLTAGDDHYIAYGMELDSMDFLDIIATYMQEDEAVMVTTKPDLIKMMQDGSRITVVE